MPTDLSEGAFTGLRSRTRPSGRPTETHSEPSITESSSHSTAGNRFVAKLNSDLQLNSGFITEKILSLRQRAANRRKAKKGKEKAIKGKGRANKGKGKTKAGTKSTIRTRTESVKEQTPQVSPGSQSSSDESSLSSEEEEDEDQANMTDPSRPSLKISFSKRKISTTDNAVAASPVAESSVPGPTKLKLKFRKPDGPSQAASVEGHQAQQRDDQHGQFNQLRDMGARGPVDELSKRPLPPLRKLTLTNKSKPDPAPTPTTLKLKHKGKIPKREPGSGYDSELEERELDPTIIESWLFKMPVGPDNDYIHSCYENGTMGVPRSKGGADIHFRLFDAAGRRGVVTIRGQRYAMSMVDMPTIIEAMKSWDKKNFVKTADICQMMLVLGKINNDEEAKNYPLPEDVNPDNHQYAHGMTPPMQFVRQRRFARTYRRSTAELEAVERKVEQMLADDDAAVSTRIVINHDDDEEGDDDDDDEEEMGDYFDEDEDAKGDDIFPATSALVQAEEEAEDDDFLRAAFETDDQPMPDHDAAETPGADTSGVDDEGEESEEEEEEMDEEQREAAAQRQKTLTEIEDLKADLAKQQGLFVAQTNQILRKKLHERIERIKGDLETARKSVGLDAEGDEDAEVE